MWVLLIYVVLMIAGDALDVGIGALASNAWGDPISLPIFLACYFLTLWLARDVGHRSLPPGESVSLL